MAVISKVLARTAAATTSTTLYTTPAGSTAVVTNIVICNPTTAAVTASLAINSIDLLGSVSIAANTSAFFDLKQVVPATQVIGSAVSSVNVTSAFSTTYDAYKIVISGGVASTVVNLGLKLGASAASYSYITTGVNSAGSAATSRVTSGASFALAGSGNADTLNLNLDIVNPFLAKYSLVNTSFADDNTTGYVMLGTHKVATSYTDFTLTPSSGTLTGGTIRVYGYKN